MQNWLAELEPSLFFGVEDGSVPEEEPLGKIVFTQLLENSDHAHEPGVAKRAYPFQCELKWRPRLAGQTWELPKRGMLHSGGELVLAEPIRFTFPDEAPPAGTFVVTASIECQDLGVSFTHLMPTPWSAAKQHWMADGGLVSPHNGPVIKTDYIHYKPKQGQRRKEISRNLPEPYARLTNPSRISGPKRLVQSEDGTITQTCQCAPGKFDTARSVHLIQLEPRRSDVFTFVIVRCAHDQATGLRMGVCSDDGSEAWMLRVSDARLCDASGKAEKTRLSKEDLHHVLPAYVDMMGRSVTVAVDTDAQGTSTVSFCVDVGRYFAATQELKGAVRPCVHLTHKGDAVRLQDHVTTRPKDTASRHTTTRPPGSYMRGVSASHRGHSPPPQSDFKRSLRAFRPSSTSTVREPTPPRQRAPPPIDVSPVDVSSPVEYDPRCASCRKMPRSPGTPWCIQCGPRLSPGSGPHIGSPDGKPAANETKLFDASNLDAWLRNVTPVPSPRAPAR